VTIAGTATDFVGAVKTCFEKTYMGTINLCTETPGCVAYKAGCSVDSTAANARRGDVNIAYTVIAASAHADAAESAAGAFSPTAFTNAFAAVKASSTEYSSIPVPTGIVAQPPTVVAITSGASTVGPSFLLALGVAVLAMRN